MKPLFHIWLSLLILTGCLPPALPRVVKIGLVAPFEGRYRDVGYDAIYAARLAVREINAAGGIAGWNLELVAYDDRATVEMAVDAARNLAVDLDVVAVIGHYRQDNAAAAADIYREAGLSFLVIGGELSPADAPVWQFAPSPDRLADAMETISRTLAPPSIAVWHAGVLSAAALAGAAEPPHEGTAFVTYYPLPQDVPGTSLWADAYRAIGPHVPAPGIYALPTYEAIYAVADAIGAAAQTGDPSRASVALALPALRRSGYLGEIVWDGSGFWRAPVLYVYVWQDARLRLAEHLPLSD